MIATISRRINDSEVEVQDDFERKLIISADDSYKVGDSVLVVSGIIIRKVVSGKLYTAEV